jgi:CRP/FNR family cyclic AMP-dependent transcriptional regulator
MRIVDDQTRSATVLSDGKTICLAVDTSAGNRLSTSEQKDERLDFLLLLYRIFAEYMTYRLRLTNEELIRAKKEVRRLGGESASTLDKDEASDLENLMKSM